ERPRPQHDGALRAGWRGGAVRPPGAQPAPPRRRGGGDARPLLLGAGRKPGRGDAGRAVAEHRQRGPSHPAQVPRLPRAAPEQGALAPAPVPPGLRPVRRRPVEHRGHPARRGAAGHDPHRRRPGLPRVAPHLHPLAHGRRPAPPLQRLQRRTPPAAAQRPGTLPRRGGGGLRPGQRARRARQAAAPAGAGAAPRPRAALGRRRAARPARGRRPPPPLGRRRGRRRPAHPRPALPAPRGAGAAGQRRDGRRLPALRRGLGRLRHHGSVPRGQAGGQRHRRRRRAGDRARRRNRRGVRPVPGSARGRPVGLGGGARARRPPRPERPRAPGFARHHLARHDREAAGV
ncbi:MAG: Glycosyltransferase, partial [uncultured Acetobacteraceae bacterium]